MQITDEIKTKFGDNAGYVGDVHTPNGVQSLYSIQHPHYVAERIYATCTRELLKAYAKVYVGEEVDHD